MTTTTPYRTQPEDTTGMPRGIPYIIGNEAAERFCFYGMRTILVVYMTKYLLDTNGALATMTKEEAKAWFHLFVSAVYFLPFFGAILADAFLGKYWTIMGLSFVYCLGSFTLALDGTRLGLAAGLALIAIGSGGIKPCVSANVGDQFGPRNQHLLSRIFNWFYFSINFGSFFSTLLTPWLLAYYGPRYGPRVAFGVPGLFMLLATVVFWLGRKKFVRIPPAGKDFVRETFSQESLLIAAGLIPIFLAEAIFWSLWDQTGSAWVLQAEKMDRRFLGFEWEASQVQALNPILILLLIPVCTYWLYPAISRWFPLSPLRKVSLGLFLTVPTFLITAQVEKLIENTSPLLVAEDLARPAAVIQKLQEARHPLSVLMLEKLTPETRQGVMSVRSPETPPAALQVALIIELNRLTEGPMLYEAARFKDFRFSPDTMTRIERAPKGKELVWLNRALLEESFPAEIAKRRGPTIWWHLLAFVIISLAEIMVSITCLEFAYTQAPKKLKSLIMSLNLMSISLGNAVTSGINFFIQNPDGSSKLPGASYFLFFALLMLLTAVAFIFIALNFRERTFNHEQNSSVA